MEVLALAYILVGPTGEIGRSAVTSYPVPDRARDLVWGHIKEEATSNIDGLDGRSYCSLVCMMGVSQNTHALHARLNAGVRSSSSGAMIGQGTRCFVWRPSGSHHCRICQRCVSGSETSPTVR